MTHDARGAQPLRAQPLSAWPMSTTALSTIRKVAMNKLHLSPRLARLLRQERGAATAEYGIVIMAAVGFAGLLVVILRSEEVRGILTDLVRNALAFGG
ncbi:DUF4244 domain-containing protein [Homoserinimonas hongtaonis]|uniref:DUF4244 domain-containing protein n=1 Tax=Homoserinimonas hongtaonis TaxID=2079791 RepID=UPI001F54266B|nr:DUF4244 domain-containing protein [Salinibacterium hongtaonis]